MDKKKIHLGFPYPKEFEREFNRSQVRAMYKPLLAVVLCVMLLVLFLVACCLFWPQTVAPATYIPYLLTLHLCFIAFTVVVLLACVLLRRWLYQRPGAYVAICNAYAVGICLWSSLLAAYGNFYDMYFTAFVYVSLVSSLVSLFKPLAAIAAYAFNFCFYVFLLHIFLPPHLINPDPVMNAAFAAILSSVVAGVMYHYRTKIFYDNLTITRQNEKISSINQELQKLVYLDELTGLHNRRYFEEVLPEKLEAIMGGGLTPCVMMLDIDFFKNYNDLYGHQAGDICLRRVSDIMRRSMRGEQAHFVRYGGEEFLVLAAAKDAQHAQDMAQGIRKAVSGAFLEHLDTKRGIVTVSIGVAMDDRQHPATLRDLAGNADRALYTAKDEGRNRVVLFEQAAGAL